MTSGTFGEKKLSELTAQGHCFGEANLHLQFTPKKRRPVFGNIVVREECRNLFVEKAAELGITILALEFGPDHVHLFISGWKNYAIPNLAQHFKGFSARKIRQVYPQFLNPCMGNSLWTDAYFFETVGRVTSETVKYYIERHRKKHWQHEEYDAHHHMQPKIEPRQALLTGFFS